MNPIKMQNEYGETIEVRRGKKGTVEVRHSDIDVNNFWPFTEITAGKKVRDASVAALMAMLGKAQATKGMGGYLMVNGQSSILNPAEVAMIREAVKKLE
jgi:hypothetical protein